MPEKNGRLGRNNPWPYSSKQIFCPAPNLSTKSLTVAISLLAMDYLTAASMGDRREPAALGLHP